MTSYIDYIADPKRDCAIVAHRGAWRDAPENSLLAIENAIAAGYPIVEIDVRMSADGKLFLMHDDTLDRMAGKAVRAEQLAIAELNTIVLRNADGGDANGLTDQRVPLLEQALEVARGRIFVDLDLKHRGLFDEVAARVAAMGVSGQVDLKARINNGEDVEWVRRYVEPAGIPFMAMARFCSDTTEATMRALKDLAPFMCEAKFDRLQTLADQKDQLRAAGIAIWVNTLDPVSCCGLTDSAALDDPDAVWGRLIDAGVSAIQTDEPAALKAYLESAGSMNGLSPDAAEAIMSAMREAGRAEILPRFNSLASMDIRTKSGPDDLVTDADIGAERVLTQAIGNQFPGALMVGEEAVAADPTVLDGLGNAALAVIIDPVDGTWNFANGIPLFGTIIAIVVGNETVAGFIHFPLAGDFVMALKGQGAWHLAANGARTPLRVSKPVPCAQMSGLVALSLFPRERQASIAPNLPAFARTTAFRCSAYEYRLIAQGSMAFSLNAGLMPWDHAAGQLIHAEAGGFSSVLDGERYRPDMVRGHLLLAPDKSSWNAIHTELWQ